MTRISPTFLLLALCVSVSFADAGEMLLHDIDGLGDAVADVPGEVDSGGVGLFGTHVAHFGQSSIPMIGGTRKRPSSASGA